MSEQQESIPGRQLAAQRSELLSIAASQLVRQLRERQGKHKRTTSHFSGSRGQGRDIAACDGESAVGVKLLGVIGNKSISQSCTSWAASRREFWPYSF